MHKTYCIFSSLFRPHVGGQEQFTEHIGAALAARGNDVAIVTCRIDDRSPAVETLATKQHREHDGSDGESGEVRIIRVESTRLLGGRYPVPKRKALQRVLDGLESEGVDQVVVNARFYELSIAGARFAHALGQRPIIIDHGSAHLTLGTPLLDMAVSRMEHLQTKRILRFPADYFGVSEKSCRWLGHFGISACGIIPNAIDADAFCAAANDAHFRRDLGIPSDHILVSFCGRLCPEKGVRELLEAARGLIGLANVHFILAGEGPLRTAVEAARLERVHAVGLQSPPDIAALLAESDIFCLPTRSEGFSTALLEAAACRTAPVITDVGGARELIPSREYGIILEDMQPDTIAQAIRLLASDDGYRRSCAERIAQRVRGDYSWDKAACALERASDRGGRA